MFSKLYAFLPTKPTYDNSSKVICTDAVLWAVNTGNDLLRFRICENFAFGFGSKSGTGSELYFVYFVVFCQRHALIPF
jgi:hypothetical protein